MEFSIKGTDPPSQQEQTKSPLSPPDKNIKNNTHTQTSKQTNKRPTDQPTDRPNKLNKLTH